MQFKNNIISTALLGTNKKQINVSDLTNALKPSVEEIEKEESDTESKFLKIATLTLSFYKAGIKPLKLSLVPDEAPSENLNYCSPASSSILKETLRNKYNTLTWLWCKLCAQKSLIIQPHLLPDLFEWGVATKKYSKELFRSVIGNRGIWLSKFSENWNFISTEVETEDWDTGTIQQRVKYLENLRTINPDAAIEKIQTVWKEENAANRVDLIDTLVINISKKDENFLSQILSDKSQKVKEKAWQLLKLIPDSEIILKYQQILMNSIRISQSKMLGLINKTNVDIKLISIDEDIFKTGIQNLSVDKKISDDDFILMQLIAEVPPEFWETQFNCNISETIKLFASKDELKKFQSSLCNAVLKFNHKIWCKEILEQFDVVPVRLLHILDEEERINYAGKFLQDNLEEVINAMRTTDLKEWNTRFTKQLLTITSQNISLYSRNFYENICIYLPSSIINDLDKLTFSEEWRSNSWANITPDIIELITIKEKIKNTF